jgi:hypothetical protein
MQIMPARALNGATAQLQQLVMRMAAGAIPG